MRAPKLTAGPGLSHPQGGWDLDRDAQKDINISLL